MESAPGSPPACARMAWEIHPRGRLYASKRSSSTSFFVLNIAPKCPQIRRSTAPSRMYPSAFLFSSQTPKPALDIIVRWLGDCILWYLLYSASWSSTGFSIPTNELTHIQSPSRIRRIASSALITSYITTILLTAGPQDSLGSCICSPFYQNRPAKSSRSPKAPSSLFFYSEYRMRSIRLIFRKLRETAQVRSTWVSATTRARSTAGRAG